MSTTPLRRGSTRPIRRSKAASLIAAGAAGALLFAIGPVAASTSHATKGVTISTTSTKKLGTYLVSGLTLYQLNKTDCTSAKCLKAWPPLLLPKGVTKATAGPGVNAVKLGTLRTATGALQVTYGGKALFWFIKDTAPGQVTGNNVKDQWGLWTIYTTVKPKSSGTTTTSPSSGGVSTTTTHAGAGTTSTTSPGSGGVTSTTASPSTGGVSF
jgi:predicted lipoprotein with Yx(FWY)xxD motif